MARDFLLSFRLDGEVQAAQAAERLAAGLNKAGAAAGVLYGPTGRVVSRFIREDLTGSLSGAAKAATTTGAALGGLGATMETRLFAPMKGWLLGMVGFGAFVSAIRGTLAFADEVSNLSRRLSISTDDIQAWMLAAKTTGTSIEEIAMGIRQLRVSMAEALEKPGARRSAFELLNVSLEQLQSKQPAELFNQLSVRLAEGALSTQEFAAAVEVLGRRADRLIAAFRDDFAAAVKKFRDSGAIITEEDNRRLKEANDELAIMSNRLYGMLAPGLSHVLKGLTAEVKILSAIPTILGAWSGGGWKAAKEEWKKTLNEVQAAITPLPPKPLLPPLPEVAETAAKEKAEKKISIGSGRVVVPTSELQRIGLFIGGAGLQGASLVRSTQELTAELHKARAQMTRLTLLLAGLRFGL
jgi:hypothetical protein